MSTQPNDGGPAFACASDHFDQAGMTMRDYFAAAALQGYLAGRNSCRHENPSNHQALIAAEYCYRYADAMLAAGDGKEGA